MTTTMSTSRSNQLSYAPKPREPFVEYAPGRTRTPNLLVRSQTLYPIELRALTPPHMLLLNAHDRTRTCTPFPTLVPQTSLSTNSSTWASNGLTCQSLAQFRMLEEGLEPSRG